MNKSDEEIVASSISREHAMPWEKHPVPWTDVVVKNIKPPTRIHCRSCRCERCKKPQTTRLIRCVCECGCIVRITRVWLWKVGEPSCGCGQRMKSQVPADMAIEEGETPHSAWLKRVTASARRNAAKAAATPPASPPS